MPFLSIEEVFQSGTMPAEVAWALKAQSTAAVLWPVASRRAQQYLVPQWQ
jgi:hypothetical protein